jgi:hypothetical protein
MQPKQTQVRFYIDCRFVNDPADAPLACEKYSFQTVHLRKNPGSINLLVQDRFQTTTVTHKTIIYENNQ